MAHLTKPERYNIEDTNIALLGSELEKRVREHAGDKDAAWDAAGKSPGIQVWRVEKFKVVPWPPTQFGVFYSGDSYIVLHTYKGTSDSGVLAYDLHFWLGSATSQDEAGTAAYKTVELDDHLHGVPVQYREVQHFESPQFLSYFQHFTTLEGGVDSGFHHVTSPPPLNLHRLYHIKAITPPNSRHGTQLVTRQVEPNSASVKRAEGAVLVLDKGPEIWQFNRMYSAGKERFGASQFVRNIADERERSGVVKHVDIKVFDEGERGAGIFLEELGTDAASIASLGPVAHTVFPASLFRLSDATGAFTLTRVSSPHPRVENLSSGDVFILDNTGDTAAPMVYVWIGKDASGGERRIGVQFAQTYLSRKAEENAVRASIVKINEGRENEAFLQTLGA